jgi:PAS domain S-box-containing protein
MHWRTDDQTICTDVSDTWSSKVGRSVESLRGEGWLQIIHPDDRERIRKETVTLRATRQTYLQFYRVSVADGTDVRVRVRVSPEQRGDTTGYVHVASVCQPVMKFGQPLIASIVRPPPLVVAPATIAEDEDSCPRVAAAVE